jgi:hypothetical protein
LTSESSRFTFRKKDSEALQTAGQLGSAPSVVNMSGGQVAAYWYWICPSKDDNGSICQFDGSKVVTLKLGDVARYA